MSDVRSPQLKRGIQQTKARSANYQIIGSESTSAFSNDAAPGAIVLTLPNATVGQEYWFRVTAAQTLTVQAKTGNTIGTKGSGGSYSSATLTNLLWVKCFVAGA